MSGEYPVTGKWSGKNVDKTSNARDLFRHDWLCVLPKESQKHKKKIAFIGEWSKVPLIKKHLLQDISKR